MFAEFKAEPRVENDGDKMYIKNVANSVLDGFVEELERYKNTLKSIIEEIEKNNTIIKDIPSLVYTKECNVYSSYYANNDFTRGIYSHIRDRIAEQLPTKDSMKIDITSEEVSSSGGYTDKNIKFTITLSSINSTSSFPPSVPRPSLLSRIVQCLS